MGRDLRVATGEPFDRLGAPCRERLDVERVKLRGGEALGIQERCHGFARRKKREVASDVVLGIPRPIERDEHEFREVLLAVTEEEQLSQTEDVVAPPLDETVSPPEGCHRVLVRGYGLDELCLPSSHPKPRCGRRGRQLRDGKESKYLAGTLGLEWKSRCRANASASSSAIAASTLISS